MKATLSLFVGVLLGLGACATTAPPSAADHGASGSTDGVESARLVFCCVGPSQAEQGRSDAVGSDLVGSDLVYEGCTALDLTREQPDDCHAQSKVWVALGAHIHHLLEPNGRLELTFVEAAAGGSLNRDRTP